MKIRELFRILADLPSNCFDSDIEVFIAGDDYKVKHIEMMQPDALHPSSYLCLEAELIKRTTHESLINDIVDNFDFVKVQKVMKMLDWKWSNADGEGVPGIGRMKEVARHILESALQQTDKADGGYSATGGFAAHAWNDNGEVCARLVFELNEYETYEQE